ncbi:calponin homology domain-containing protein DDB_G0272472-like [Clarias gariepinus]|uniref:calponin homology domain-containing protein DDB_G0272472-like n=1 Tax=Clarias gariepinus TaxID=13013 RepID=UPI00234CE462|nr:calponin homology domain-containing protein DDB_G0272472-like [Clarias gariepinus]
MSKSLKHKDQQLEDYKRQIENKDAEPDESNEALQMKNKTLEEKDTQLKKVKEELAKANTMLEENKTQLKDKERQLWDKTNNLMEKDKLLTEYIQLQFREVKEELVKINRTLEENQTQLKDKERQLKNVMNELESSKSKLIEQDKQLQEKERLLEEIKKQMQEQRDSESSSAIRRRNSKEMPPTMGGESSSPHSPLLVPAAELRLVLLGRTGSGKSAARNTILSRGERNQAATSTSTQQSESTQGEVAGRKVTVVDTPDWFSPGLSLEKLRQDVGLCVHLSDPGPHVFLLVIPVKRPTGDERGMLEKMEEIFGERCWRNTMIIFSVTDELQKKNIEEFIQSGEQEVQRLVEKCGNRFYCLNIKQSGDGSQGSELLKKIEKIVEGSRVKLYSSEIYLETESQIRLMETKILKEREEKRMREEMEVRKKIDKEVQDSLRKMEGAIQEHEGDIKQLDDRTTKLERKMKEERDEEKKRELERELEREVARRAEMEEKVKKLKEKRERERREMEERHQQEIEEISEVYEREVRMEAEKKIMKIILPELQRNILASKTKMQEEFSRQMEEKNRELETFKQKLSNLTETQSQLGEVYGKTVSSSESERAVVTGEVSKGIFQTFKDYVVTG